MMFNKLFQFVEMLQQTGGLRAAVLSRPRSATSFLICSRLKRAVPNLATVIDCGANVGQFARAVSDHFPNAQVISFEPLPDIANCLRQNLSDINSHTVHEYALGETTKKVTFHRASNNGQSSSIFEFSKDEGNLVAGLSQTEKLEVDQVTLDQVLDGQELPCPILLKMDLQGAELRALRGSEKTLARTKYLMVESALCPSYQGEPLFAEIVEFLHRKNFTLSRLLNTEYGPNKEIAQVDALFENKDLADVAANSSDSDA